MKNVRLVLSLALNALVIGFLGWSTYKVMGTMRGAGSSTQTATVVEVVDYEDAGFTRSTTSSIWRERGPWCRILLRPPRR